MSRKTILFWFFVYFVALACLSTAYLIDEKKIKRQEEEISRVDNALVQLATKAYDAKPLSYRFLKEANYCMELPINSKAAIVSKVVSKSNREKTEYILLQDPPPGFCLEYWQVGWFRTLPWSEISGEWK